MRPPVLLELLELVLELEESESDSASTAERAAACVDVKKQGSHQSLHSGRIQGRRCSVAIMTPSPEHPLTFEGTGTASCSEAEELSLSLEDDEDAESTAAVRVLRARLRRGFAAPPAFAARGGIVGMDGYGMEGEGGLANAGGRS